MAKAAKAQMTAEREHALALAGPRNEDALEAIARHLHYNESLHMHTLGSETSDDPCGYCWLRAGKAIQALRLTKLTLIFPNGRKAERTGDAT